MLYINETSHELDVVIKNQYVTGNIQAHVWNIKLCTSQSKCAKYIKKYMIQRDLSLWLKVLNKVSIQHAISYLQFKCINIWSCIHSADSFSSVCSRWKSICESLILLLIIILVYIQRTSHTMIDIIIV